ncbi:hypothetical protein PtB15_2B48 [Puccinia triticina]|nr:hypothetical protein PtB15_2B48 [Puccinia triticina]
MYFYRVDRSPISNDLQTHPSGPNFGPTGGSDSGHRSLQEFPESSRAADAKNTQVILDRRLHPQTPFRPKEKNNFTRFMLEEQVRHEEETRETEFYALASNLHSRLFGRRGSVPPGQAQMDPQDAAASLGLVLHWLSSTMDEFQLQDIFAISPRAYAQSWTRGRKALLAVLKQLPGAKIYWPTKEKSLQELVEDAKFKKVIIEPKLTLSSSTKPDAEMDPRLYQVRNAEAR